MSKFQQVMSKKPPHVGIRYVSETESFSYGVVGNMPIGALVGYLIRVQAELAFRNPDPCDAGLCIITYDGKKFHWFTDSGIPVDALVGTIELIKAALVDSQMAALFQAAQKRAETGLVASNGQPILKEVLRGN